MGDSRPLLGYLRSKRQDNMGVSLIKDGGTLYSDSLTQASILDKEFKSVFNHLELGEIRKRCGPNYPDIADLHISIQDVEKLLRNICPTMASGPDSISCCFFKQCSNELAPILFFNNPCPWAKYHLTG